MLNETFKQKLATMLSADVVGYSRLMGKDEAGTVKTLTIYRNIMTELIKQYRGRMVDSPGDNLFADFSSVGRCCPVRGGSAEGIRDTWSRDRGRV